MKEKSVVIIAGYTASGKSSVLEYMVNNLGYEKIITTTTRKPRPGEENGVDYHFLSKSEFSQKKKEGDFLENIEFNDNYYGVDIKSFEKDFKNNKMPVLILDPKGLVVAKKKLEEENWHVTTVFIDETLETCLDRVRSREDSPENIEKRVKSIEENEKNWGDYTRYDCKTIPLSSIKDNANFIVDFHQKALAKQKELAKKSKIQNGKKKSYRLNR